MSQEYEDIPVTEKVYDSLSKLLQRDETGVTASVGIDFPEVESWMVGRLCLRTDLKTLYYLAGVDEGGAHWGVIADFSQPLATLSHVQSNYQPINSNLTALSDLPIQSNSIPYFSSSTAMSVLSMTPFLTDWLSTTDAVDAREKLGLGSLATVDQITSSNVSSLIDDGALPISKFNFTPIQANEGYTTGDIKESYNSSAEEGYIDLNHGYTIGDSGSGSTYQGSTYNNLFFKLWSSNSVTFYTSTGDATSRGSSSTADWSAKKRLGLPNNLNYINPNCYYRIKI